MIIVNGADCPQAAGLTVKELLEQEGYPTKSVAVECNGNIVPKNKYEAYRFSDGDVVEVVRFVGGG